MNVLPIVTQPSPGWFCNKIAYLFSCCPTIQTKDELKIVKIQLEETRNDLSQTRNDVLTLSQKLEKIQDSLASFQEPDPPIIVKEPDKEDNARNVITIKRGITNYFWT